MRTKELCAFIKAREAARLAKEAGKVYKTDPIIAKYRFCNVRRNDDRVTKFVLSWASQWATHPEQWFAFVVARLFNQPETLSAIADCVLPFKPEKMRERLQRRKAAGEKIFNAAYIVSTNGLAMDKVDYVVQRVLAPIWAVRKNISLSMRGATLAQMQEVLMRQQGLGSFMAAQVLADLKYTQPERWDDFHTFAASGPGSKRGLSRVVTGDLGMSFTETKFRAKLAELRIEVNLKLRWDEPLTAQDLQNCLCEFDKYERARLGQGEPKQIYTPYKEK